MKRTTLFLLIAGALFMCCCKNKTTDAKVNFSPEMVQVVEGGDTICVLGEDQALLKVISDIEFVSDTSFLATSAGQAIMYNTKGDQLKVLTTFGRSKRENMGACEVYATDQNLYVWDDMALAMLVFDKQGEFRDKYTEFKTAIAKFSVLDNRYICFYKSGGRMDDVVGIYDMNDKYFVGEFDTNSHLDAVLSMRSNVGGIDANSRGEVIYCKPSSLKLNVVARNNLASGQATRSIEIVDKQFELLDDSDDVLSRVQGDVYQALEVGNRNGCILDVQCQDDKIYVLSECGRYDVQAARNIDRVNKVYVLDADMQPIKVVELPYLQLFAHCFYRNNLYYVTTNQGDETQGYSLCRITI